MSLYDMIPTPEKVDYIQNKKDNDIKKWIQEQIIKYVIKSLNKGKTTFSLRLYYNIPLYKRHFNIDLSSIENRGWYIKITNYNYTKCNYTSAYKFLSNSYSTSLFIVLSKDKITTKGDVYYQTKKLYIEDKCVICLEKSSINYINNCGHVCVCSNCKKPDNCPLCKAGGSWVENK